LPQHTANISLNNIIRFVYTVQTEMSYIFKMKSRVGSSFGDKSDGLRLSGTITPLPSVCFRGVHRQDRYQQFALIIKSF